MISAIILRDQTDLAGVLLFSGEQLDIVDRENFDIAVDLTTITVVLAYHENPYKFLGDFAHDQRNIREYRRVLSADALNEMKEMTVKSKTYLTRIFDSSLQIGNQIENALSVDRYDPETDEHHMMVEQIDLVELRRKFATVMFRWRRASALH